MTKKTTRKIKALMILKGITSVQLARQIGVSETWFSLVLRGHKHSARVQGGIAKALGKPVKELWPGTNLVSRPIRPGMERQL